MKEFVKYAIPHIMEQENISLPSKFKGAIEIEALSQLKLKNLGELRDRYEGQAYLDRLLSSISSNLLIESQLGISLVDMNNIPKSIEDIVVVELNGQKFRVISFMFGDLPIVQTSVKLPIIFCSLRPEYKSGCVCGALYDYDYEDKTTFISESSVARGESKRFIGFSQLVELPKV